MSSFSKHTKKLEIHLTYHPDFVLIARLIGSLGVNFIDPL